MTITKRMLRRDTAQIAGDLMVLTATANGASDGSTVVCSSLNGRQSGFDVGKWVVVIFDDDANDVRYSQVSASADSPTDYTLTLTPPLGEQVTTGLEFELMAYQPDWYTSAINTAIGNVFPYLYKRLYNDSIDDLSPQVISYDLPSGIESKDITRVMMTGYPNTPFADRPYYEMTDFTFLPTGTMGAEQIVLNLIGPPFSIAPVTGCKLVLLGMQLLTQVTPDTTMYVITDDTSIVHAPELTEGSEYAQMFQEWVLAYLFRILMASPSTPDRAAFATAFNAQMNYASTQSRAHLMPRIQRRRPL